MPAAAVLTHCPYRSLQCGMSLSEADGTLRIGKFARVALRTSSIDYNGRFCMSSAAIPFWRPVAGE
jgi:anaerobic selenocysteine-containing dehydrogenase